MRAAVTESVGAMALVERPEPSGPGPHQVVVAPEAVGICGSDYHFFAGELSDAAGGFDTICPASCTSDWNTGAGVILRALPASGYGLRAWSGACSGMGPG